MSKEKLREIIFGYRTKSGKTFDIILLSERLWSEQNLLNRCISSLTPGETIPTSILMAASDNAPVLIA